VKNYETKLFTGQIPSKILHVTETLACRTWRETSCQLSSTLIMTTRPIKRGTKVQCSG